MNKIVRGNYPVSKLPADLREGLDPAAEVSITVVQDAEAVAPSSLEQIFAVRQPPFRTTDEIVSDVRKLRQEWDD